MEENKSDDSKLQICRICIEILERHQVEELNPTKVEMFKLLNVELTLLFNDQLFLCFSCSMRLKDNVEFKMGRLRNIVFCKMLQLEDDTEEYEESKMLLCKLCSQRWKICRLMPIVDNIQANNIDKDVIKKCFSEVDILSLPDLLICPNCMENLNKLSTFLVTCFKSNELIKDYVTFSNSTPLFLNMFDIFEFKLNRKKKNEENINLEIVKIENEDINNNIEYDCDVIVKEECDSMTIEECELPFVKEEYDDPIESVGFYVQIDTLDSKHKKEREYICHHCNFKTRTKATLVLHLLVHQNNAQFNCNSCEFVSKWKTSLRTHMLLHKKADEVKVYQCKKCPYKSIYRKHLRRHMEKHSTKKYYCDQCPYKTKNLGPFKTHNKRKHNKKIDIMYSDFEDEDIKLINERIKRMNKNYKCTYCPYVTHKCSRIKEHVTKHLSDDEVTWHYCDYCTFKSRYKASVNHHQKLHKHQMNIRLKKVRTSEGNVTFVKKEKSELEQDIRQLRPKSAVTDNFFETKLSKGQHFYKTLQNRLDFVVKHFCHLLTTNKKLREHIDHLLKEREQFNTIWNKLLKDIATGKKTMVELIEQATLAFDQREEWGLKVIALKKKAQIDFLAHSEEMREIQRKLDHDLTLREFLSVKGQKRILKDLEEKERKKRELEEQNLENLLTLYETTMEKIQQYCDETDVQRIASTFLKQEEENFALFNYVNELHNEIESLNIGIRDIQEKLEEQQEQSLIRSKERQTTLQNLEKDLQDARKKVAEDEQRLKTAEFNLREVLHGIQIIFNNLVSDKTPILDLVSVEAAVNLFNVHIFLGTIEKRVSNLVANTYFVEESKKKI